MHLAPPPFVAEELARLGIALPAAALDRIRRFLELLYQENQRMNLTAITEPHEAWRRHVLDSLTAVPHLAGLPAGSRVADVGSGGGLPGVPLAVALPGLDFTLIEATGKKARFLERLGPQLGLERFSILNLRAETAGQDPRHRQRYQAAISRAIGPLVEAAEYSLPLLAPGGLLIAMKGRRAAAEVEEARELIRRLGGSAPRLVPAGLPDATLVLVEKVQPTPRRYPRPPGQARAERRR